MNILCTKGVKPYSKSLVTKCSPGTNPPPSSPPPPAPGKSSQTTTPPSPTILELINAQKADVEKAISYEVDNIKTELLTIAPKVKYGEVLKVIVYHFEDIFKAEVFIENNLVATFPTYEALSREQATPAAKEKLKQALDDMLKNENFSKFTDACDEKTIYSLK